MYYKGVIRNKVVNLVNKIGSLLKMKLVNLGLFLLVICFYFVSLAEARDDSEYWTMYTFSLKLTEAIKLNLFEQLRLKNDMGNFYTYVQYAGIGYKFNDYFDIAAWYKLVSLKKNQHWSESHRFDIDGTLTLKFDNGVKLSNRSRFERNTTASSWLYRDRIKLQKKIELFDRDFTPFISNEFFLDLEPNDGCHENRGSLGFSTGFIGDTKLTIYYMSRNKKKDGSWYNANILGTTVGFSF